MGLYKIMNKRSLVKNIQFPTRAIAVEKISKLKECDRIPKPFFKEGAIALSPKAISKSFLLLQKRGDRTILTSERSPSTQSSSYDEEVVNQTKTTQNHVQWSR